MVTDALETARQRAVVLFQAYARGVSAKHNRSEEQFVHDVSTFDHELTEALRMPVSAARPTADLGEDGELVDLRAAFDGDSVPAKNIALRQAYDRLILYREALGDAFGTLHYIYETTDDDHEKRAAAEARDKIDAVLSRSGG